MTMPITTLDTFIRLVVITVLSGMIGFDREYHGKPAGLRTNVMVGLGSTLMTIASINAVSLFPDLHIIDPTRIAAQIITGIGFIGAGAILRPGGGENVIGLTTAATLWVVTGMGIAVGMGFYMEALLTGLMVFITFKYISALAKRVRTYAKEHPPESLTEAERQQNMNDSTREQ
jgi:putative Mg2+ transporter-C (MgtC) family protein